MNNRFEINLTDDAFNSLAAFKSALDVTKTNYDTFVEDKSDEEISSLRKSIAHAIIDKLFKKYPDGLSSDSSIEFDGLHWLATASRHIKSRLLRVALTHDLFNHRNNAQIYNWINSNASTFFGDDLPTVKTASQKILYRALEANDELRDVTNAAKYMSGMNGNR